jgi:hypothetical protein
MNTNDLRNRQIREILDEDIGVYKQVMDRQFKSVEAYKEEVSGKKERDLEAEVSIEKIIQQLQIKLQREVQQAEYLLSSSEQRWDERKNDKDIDNIYSHTGEILTLYNSAMRLYLKAGLSRDSQESIKIKLMQLLPFLNASNQALESVIDFMFSNGYVDNKLFWIFNTKSMLETIKNQIEGSRFKIIDNSDVMATFKNLAGFQSQERIQILKRLMDTTTPLKIRTFFNYPLDDYDLMDKVQQLEAEMGVDFSNFKKNIKGVPIQKTLLMIDEAQKNIPLYKVASQRISELVSEVDNKNREINDLEQAIIEARNIFDEAKASYDAFSRREKELKPQAQTSYKIYKQTEKLEQQFRDIQAQLLQMNKEVRRRRLSAGEERAYAALQNQFENIRDLLRGKDSDIALAEFNELKEQYGQLVVATDEAKALLNDAKNTRDGLINELKLLNKEIGDLVKEYDLVLQQEQLLQRNVQGIEGAIGNVLQTNRVNKRELQQPPSFSEERLSKEQKEIEEDAEVEDSDEKAADADVEFMEIYGNGKKNKKLQYKDNKNDIYKFMVKNKSLLIK